MSKKNLKELLEKYEDKYKDDKQSASRDGPGQVRAGRGSQPDPDEGLGDAEARAVEFRVPEGTARVEVVDAAAAAEDPSANKRHASMMMLPVGVLFAVLSLFLLLEIKAERVADPDLLSTRVQSEVFALPPLPTGQPRGLSGPTTRSTSSFSGLTICGSPSAGASKTRAWGGVCWSQAQSVERVRRLAAQLAARCGNAGISTLLIDADLRRGPL